jgi:hypothetical protein
MEITCNRCHQPVEAESCYCPACGLPQIVYSAEGSPGQAQPEREEPVRDAGSVDWKPALRAAVLLAVPAGLLTCGISPVRMLGPFWVSAAAAWAVTLYVRGRRPPWITAGAGARIGLVTGLIAGAVTFSVSGSALFAERFVLHKAGFIDNEWKSRVEASNQLTQQFAAQMGVTDTAQLQAQKGLMLSPEGHAGIEAFGMATNSLFLLLFAAAGGAIGGRLLTRSRRPEA